MTIFWFLLNNISLIIYLSFWTLLISTTTVLVFICLVLALWKRYTFHIFLYQMVDSLYMHMQWNMHMQCICKRQVLRTVIQDCDFHRCCELNVCIRQNSSGNLVCPVSSISRFKVPVHHSTNVEKIWCTEVTYFLPTAKLIHSSHDV